MKLISLYLTIATFALLGCSKAPREHRSVDVQRVIQHVHTQVNFGPRVPESIGWENARAYFVDYFDSLGYTVTLQEFVHQDYVQRREVHMCNLFMTSDSASDKKRILIAAHWDTRPRSDMDPDPARQRDSLQGANDAAAAVGILMEIAAIVKETPPDIIVDFALFDGEDWGFRTDLEQYCIGSREFGRRIDPQRYEYAIVMDIIAHKSARFYREGLAEQYAPEVNDRIWKVAGELGVSRFIDSVGIELIDDHVSLLNVGLPSANIISMNYKHWHTTEDTPDKIDSAAVADVARVVTHVIYSE